MWWVTAQKNGISALGLQRVLGLGNRLIMKGESCVGSTGEIQRRQRLGGMLNYYYGQAA
jgi:hypothetical protein